MSRILSSVLRTALTVVLALLAPRARGGTYVVVLDPAATGERVLHDADVAGIGATITGRAYGLLYIDGSAGAATALAAHSGVKYVQPVGDAEPPSHGSQAKPAGGGRIVANQAPPTWSSGEYQYDGAGNIYAIGDATLPGGNGTKIAYTYDTLSRLRTVQVSDAGHPSPRNESYMYDPYGNLTTYVTPSTAGGNGSIVTNGTNNQVTSLSYDKAGNVTADGTSLLYVRDPLNMIVVNQRVGGTDVNLYTADDERVAEGSGGYWTWSFRGFDQKVLRQYRSPVTNPFAPWLWVEDYVYAGGRLVAAERPTEEGGRRHFHLDHLGTPRMVTGYFGRLISQHDYTAYGIEYQPDSGTAANQEAAAGFDREEPMRFTGHERGFTGGTGSDTATSLDYMHARYYSASIGRFLSVDPSLDIDGSLHLPGKWNRYAYVGNNPLKYIDPDGKDWLAAWLLGEQYRNVSTWDAIFSSDTLSDINRGRQEWAEDHQAITRGFSPVPTSKGDAAITAGMFFMGPLGGPLRTTLSEAKTLVGSWGKGTFTTLAKTIAYHFEKHGAEVGAKSTLQYLRKAWEFNRNLRGAEKTILENGVRYEKNGYYIIKDLEGKIVSYGRV